MTTRHLRPALAFLPVLGMIGLYCLVIGRLALDIRRAMFHFDEDLAIYDQIVWNTSRGRPFVSTLIQHANTMFGDHFAPAVAIFAPVYWVWSSPSVLLLGQTLFLAAAAIPLFLLAQPRIGTVAAWSIAAAYLLYPGVHFVNLFQFHEIALLPLPLMCALLAIDRGWRWHSIVAAVLCLTIKEEVAFVVIGLGPLWWLRWRDVRMAVATIAFGAVTGFLTMGVLLPRFSTADSSSYYYVRRYAYLGNTVPEMIANAFLSPGLILGRLLAPDRLRFLGLLIAPLVALPLVGWELLIAGLPVFGYLLLGDSPDQYAINRHYQSPLIPFLFVGAVVGIDRLSRRIGSQRHAIFATGLAVLTILGSLAGSYLYGPTPLSRIYDAAPATANFHTGQMRRLVEAIPSGASISTSRNLLSWFSRREQVYRFPEVSNARFVLLDFRELRHPAAFQIDDGAFGRLVAAPDYRMIDSAGGTVLFERGDPTTLARRALPRTLFVQDASGGDPAIGPIALLGYRLRQQTSAGEMVIVDGTPVGDGLSTSTAINGSVELSLYWQAQTRMPVQYTVFVQGVDGTGQRVMQRDSPPVDGLMPTDTWTHGHVVVDTHTIALSQPLSGGAKVTLQVGLYDGRSGKRLRIAERGIAGGVDWVEIELR